RRRGVRQQSRSFALHDTALFRSRADSKRSNALSTVHVQLSNVMITIFHETCFRRRLLLIASIFALGVSSDSTFAQTHTEPSIPKLNYEAVPNFFQLPVGQNFVEPCGVGVNSKGLIYVFHRGRHPLMEFDSSGKYIRSIADDLFVTPHSLRVDGEDNLWTADVGAHVVLKLSP